MEVKEMERAVITKPVASKPNCSSFRSFSELLAGAINTSPPTAVAAIRPKTVRVKPMVNRASTAVLPFKGESSETAPTSLADKVAKLPVGKPLVVYKPLAKVVSKATVSLLASMFEQGTPNITHQQALAQVEARAAAQHMGHRNRHPTSQPSQAMVHQPPNIVPQQAEESQLVEPPKRASKAVEEEPKPYTAAANVDRPSYDGYNWRKYGQKQVKGSEYPRSYYKCTHPNCPVKKKVERSFDGQIAEIVYKGEHNHPKPQLPKRSSSGAQGQGLANDSTRLDPDTNNLNKSQLPLSSDTGTIGVHDIGGGTPDNSCARSADCEEGSKGLGVDSEEPRSKRRKSGNPNNEVGTSGEGKQEPRILVQNATENEIVGDGFRWRKYGQKVVKGNPYPRSYYKCTSLKCSVRKYVERSSEEDPRAFITTYEGKHNHDIPMRMTDSAAPQSDLRPPTNKRS